MLAEVVSTHELIWPPHVSSNVANQLMGETEGIGSE